MPSARLGRDTQPLQLSVCPSTCRDFCTSQILSSSVPSPIGHFWICRPNGHPLIQTLGTWLQTKATHVKV
ncbi:hypothetical protein CCR75_005476 [Bremia lactucae]|uniref:Uncharacterized protein n=1 Tax=Bremia lactucae TaxID=4779 RepID=A0A976FJA6_BRELC|nr:hypothetical protein CCR75_005476 [Bremia lactucae]